MQSLNFIQHNYNQGGAALLLGRRQGPHWKSLDWIKKKKLEIESW